MTLRSRLPEPLISDKPIYERVLRSLSDVDPRAIALLCSETGKTYTVAETVGAATAVATILHEAGLRKSEVVAYCMRNCPQAVFAVLGSWMCGAIACGVNPDYTKRTILL
ncbi:unnamed protein product [Soboliphyme baturini]|uniref:AMP-binding domain-containing protein n=1 Tax=Soboliphyme baturini TaxID=241478 RepID=A0A183J9Y3_9BILA|nr:unnamed protein product [Soboliphyme baturini]